MENGTVKRFIWVSIYAIAMAFMEAVVVAYIRALLDISDTHVSLGSYVRMEVWREAATLVMLAAVGWIAGRRWDDRWAYGLFAFGLWDIFYYVWLRVLLGWPASLLDWDILFLIPLRWWGPVLAPMSIAALICMAAILAVARIERGHRLGITPWRIGLVTAGSLLALYVFMSDALYAWLTRQPNWIDVRPTPFKWPLFLAAWALMAIPTLAATWPQRTKHAGDKKPIPA